MKLKRRQKDSVSTETKKAEKSSKFEPERSPWKVLIVDDEPDIHSMTHFALKNFEFAGRQLQLFQAISGQEAQNILSNEPDMAVALIDVVMETDDAGLKLVDFIRNELKYSLIRLIIRTGQPGMAPEKEVIERYDIDDYKNKTDLRAEKLYTTMRVALKSYRDLSTLDYNQRALKQILDTTPAFYRAQSFNPFFNDVLTQIISLCNLSLDHQTISLSNGLIMTLDNDQILVQAGTGRFESWQDNSEVDKITHLCSEFINKSQSNESFEPFALNALLMPLEVHDKRIGFVYLENAQYLSQVEQNFIHIMVNQCATALENLQLYLGLKEANQQTLQMLKVAETARQEAEAANHVKSTFLANISHEFRTPLNCILGYTQLLQDDNTLAARQKEDINIIQHSGNYLLKLVNDILELSKLETGTIKLHPNDFRLNSFLNEIVKMFQISAEQKGIDLIYQTLSNLPTVIYADEKRLRQILIHLLSNAVKFTEQGGITFQVKSEKLPAQDGLSNSSQFQLYFKITDTGIGISKEAMEKVFLPFEQASDWRHKSEGTGVGLPITKQLIEMMGGELHVESHLEKGSQFWFELVFPETLKWQEPTAPTIVGYQGKRRKILLIDDYEGSRFLLISFLEPLGFEICEADDGSKGLEKIREFKPDLIITDLVMPGMDGFELIRQIRNSPDFQWLPILVLSTSVLEGHQPGDSTDFCNGFFSKPFRVEQLLARLQEHLNLTWIYQDFEKEKAESDKDRMNLSDIPSLVSPLRESYLTSARKLIELAQMGHFEGIIALLEQIEKTDSELQAFVEKIRHFANNYNSDSIIELVERYFGENGIDSTGKFEDSEPLVKLPNEQATLFYHLTRKGDIMEIIKQSNELEKQNEQFAPIAHQIRQLAENFKLRKIRELVQSFMD
jgi:signal transduction histidine kinase/PleD family two-component response regulator